MYSVTFSNKYPDREIRVFDPRVPLEPAYPSLIASVAETAYYEDTEDGVHSKKAGGDVGKKEEVAIVHAPPG
jgi:hypothetical protein